MYCLRKLFFTFFIIATGSCLSSLAMAAPICVVSLVHESKVNQVFPEQIKWRLSQMGHKQGDSGDYFSFHGDLMGISEVYSSLKNCIEGNYEEVFIVAHSMKNIIGQSVLIFPSSKSGDKVELATLDDRFFKNLSPGNNLKQISIVGCNSEEVLLSYSYLSSLTKKHQINIKQARTSGFLSWLNGTVRGRSLSRAVHMIAESAQPRDAKVFFCNVNYQFSEKYSCLSHRIQITPKSSHAKNKTSRWIRIQLMQSGNHSVAYRAPSWDRWSQELLIGGNQLKYSLNNSHSRIENNDYIIEIHH